MRITIIAIGSRGDVHPQIALGRGLQSDGHAVRLATHARFAETAKNYGLDYMPVADVHAAVDGIGGHQLLAEKSHSLRLLNKLTHLVAPYLYQGMADCWQACQDTDLIITSGLGILSAYHIAEKLEVPLVRAYHWPVSPSRTYPTIVVPDSLHLGERFNLLSHHLRAQFWWLLLRPSVNQARSEVLGLAPLSLRDPFGRLDRERALLLYGISPLLFPRPADWGDWICETGYWFLDRPSSWRPPPGLVDFLESGPPPVFVGFGSMDNSRPEEMTELVVKSLARTRQRGMLLTGWGGLAKQALSDDVYFVDEIPYDWLLPKMRAVVHHGATGTMHSVLRAGVPSVVIPFLPDQRFWGRRATALGACPPIIARAALSVDRLVDAIRVVTTDTGMQQRALALSRRIQSEDGVARAVAAFHTHLHIGQG